MNQTTKFQAVLVLFVITGMLVRLVFPDSPMSKVVSVLGFLLIGPVIYLSLKQNGRQVIWLKLVEKFKVERGLNSSFNYTVQPIFFRTTSDEKFSIHNRMKVRETQDEIEIQPTFETAFAEPILIPKSAIEFVRKERMLLGIRRIYRVKNLSIEIALT